MSETGEIKRPGRIARTIEDRLEETFAGIALGIMAMGDEHCASIMARNSRPMAEAWGSLARQNPAVKRVLERILTGGAWGGVIMATAATAIPIAAHHGLFPEDWPMPFEGFTIPDAPPIQDNGQPEGEDVDPTPFSFTDEGNDATEPEDRTGSSNPPPQNPPSEQDESGPGGIPNIE